jgi:hypothetical protein
MARITDPKAILVTPESLESDEPGDLSSSVIDFVNAMLESHHDWSEIPRAALLAYYVDFFVAQLNNGGFSQFVYNTRWNPEVLGYVREGLEALAAQQVLAVLDRGESLVAQLGEARLEAFLDGEYWDESPARDRLDTISGKLLAAIDQDDVTVQNDAWIRDLPELVAASAEAIAAEIERRMRALPDLEDRIERARAEEPPLDDLARALCEVTGQDFERITGGDPNHHHNGRPVVAWHFRTDRGPHYLVVDREVGEVLMFHSETNLLVTSIPVPDDLEL